MEPNALQTKPLLSSPRRNPRPIAFGASLGVLLALTTTVINPALPSARADDEPVSVCADVLLNPIAVPSLAPTDVVAPGDVLSVVRPGDVIEGRTISAVSWIMDGVIYPNSGQSGETSTSNPDTTLKSTPYPSRYVGARHLGSTLTLVVSYLLSSGSPYCGLAISATNPVRVQAPTKVSAKLAPNQRSLTDGAVAVDVTVKSNTGLTPNGTVTVTWKGGAKSAILKKSAKGKMRIELPSLPAKKVNLSIEFTDPTTRFASSQAKKLPVAPSQ